MEFNEENTTNDTIVIVRRIFSKNSQQAFGDKLLVIG